MCLPGKEHDAHGHEQRGGDRAGGPGARRGQGTHAIRHRQIEEGQIEIERAVLEVIVADRRDVERMGKEHGRPQQRHAGLTFPDALPDPEHHQRQPQPHRVFERKRREVDRSGVPPRLAGDLGVVGVGQPFAVIETAKHEVTADEDHERHRRAEPGPQSECASTTQEPGCHETPIRRS